MSNVTYASTMRVCRSMTRVLIIGFGNPLRSDDGLGWLAAKELSGEFAEGVQIVAVHQLLPEMTELVSHAERVLFIDAARHGVPGEIRVVEVGEPEPSGTQSHELTPATVLKLAADLYGKRPASQLLTVTGENFETGDTLTPRIAAALVDVLKRAREWVHSAQST